MPQFVALLRGVGPTNPKMRNQVLCAAFTKLGFTRVRPVLASGNLVFASSARRTATLETKIERGLAQQLDLTIEVFVRSERELRQMIADDPFHGATHGGALYLTVTFRKEHPEPVFTTLDRSTMTGPEFMAQFEKDQGKHITTRTWATIHKIVAKMDAPAEL